MSFFKKLFGQKGSQDSNNKKMSNQGQPQNKTESNSEESEDIKYHSEIRQESLKICSQAGFKPAAHLPTEWDRNLRPSTEIAGRLNVIKAMVLWLMVPTEHLPNDRITNFVSNNNLNRFMDESEAAILESSRDDVDNRNAIGWKFENAWPLAWYFGYKKPKIDGEMMSGEQMQDILVNFSCPLDENVETWASQQVVISEDMIIKMEDLFYCLHNAVRSAQLGGETLPLEFDPIVNGGVIHERRHSLTWMLSEGIDWNDTDLST